LLRARVTNSELKTPAKLAYRPDIDGLRAIAVLSVVAFHAFPDSVKGGFVGVDIFFVISGFLISRIVLSDLESSRFSLLEFYSRRVRRIFPSLLLVLTACLAFGWIALFPHELKELGKHTAAGAGFVSNFAYWHESGYFDASADTKPLLHLWSLGIEEQYYIIWPLFLYFSWKARFKPMGVTVAVAAFSFASSVGKLNGDAVARFYSPQTRFWELLLGSGLAYLTLFDRRTLDRFTLRNSNLQSLIGAALLVAGILLTDERGFPGWWALLPTTGSALLISAGPATWVNRGLLSSRVLVWFGLISYPLYLWHWPLLTFMRMLDVHGASNAAIAAGVVLSVVLAWLSYVLLERPVRRGRHGTAKTAILVVLMIATGAVGLGFYRHDGFSSRLEIRSAAAAELFGGFPHEPFHNGNCDSSFAAFSGLSACLLSQPEKPDVALIGDSHSEQLWKSMALRLRDHSVMNLAQWRCFPFATDTFERYGDCEQKLSAVLAFLRRESTIRTVYLAGSWSYLAAGGMDMPAAGWRVSRPLDSAQLRSFTANGERMLSALVSYRRNVVLILDMPGLQFDPKTCIDVEGSFLIRYRAKRKNSCFISRAAYNEARKDFDVAFSGLLKRFPDVQIYDPRPLFCDADVCRGTKNGTIVYYNGDHPTREGADDVVGDLLRQHPPSPRR
jgi:peptidoglycan/LPS O-acetylase OafA/YrhL